MITGFQKLSLVDYPGRPCSIVFTQGCFFRCSYCHNPELVPLRTSASDYKTEDVFALLEKGKNMIDAVCITGGEPTIHDTLESFIRSLKQMGFAVKLDTNGMHPKKLSHLLSEKLVDYIAMDIKHVWDRYGEVTKNKSADIIESCKISCRVIQDSDVPHEFRTTIFPGVHSKEDFFEMAGYFDEGEHYFIQQTSFIKNLDPVISRDIGFDVAKLTRDLQTAFPALLIEER